jgi:hypothetical protein
MNASIVALINFIFGRIVRILSSYEVHETYTNYNLSVALKLTFTRFINTGLIPLAVHFDSEDWFNTSGLATDIFVISIAIAFFSPIIDLLEPMWLLNKIIRCREKRKGKDCKLSQEALNKLYEAPPIDMAQWYCDTYLLLTVSFFYISLVPIISVICILGVVYQYWLEKYLLLRRYKTPEQYGKRMAIAFGRIMPFWIFLWSLGQFVFISSLSEGENEYCQIPLWVSITYMVIPIRMIFNFIETMGGFTKREVYYDDHFEGVATEYEKANPVSFGRSYNYLDKSHSSSERDDGAGLIPGGHNDVGFSTKNLNYDNLINYARKGTLNDRVIDNYQNLRYIRNDSRSQSSNNNNNPTNNVLHRLNMMTTKSHVVKKK